MGYAWAMLIWWVALLSILFATQDERPDLCCPSCAWRGSEIVEEERLHLGWEDTADRWLPRYAVRRHFRCRHCSYGWAADA